MTRTAQEALFGPKSHVGVANSVPGKSALEVDFPASELSLIAQHESWRKEVHRPATHTHKWWAQRLGSVFRGVLVSAVTEDAEEAVRAYSSPYRLQDLVVYDPFAGSGTTLVEAVKLGADVIGRDVNPVATLVQRQALQAWNAERLGRLFVRIEKGCRAEIDRLHRTKDGDTVLYYFWVAMTRCMECGECVRLFSNHVFARHAYPKRYPTARAVCPECMAIATVDHDVPEFVCVCGHAVPRSGAVRGASLTCSAGHRQRVVDALGGDLPAYEMYAKLVLRNDGSKEYVPIDDHDRALYEESERLLAAHGDELLLPEGFLEAGYNTRQAMRWGFVEWRQFFNARQLYSLGRLACEICGLPESPEREALCALFSGVLEFNNRFCSFKGEGTGAVRHMFSNHVLKPERTPLEAHPWGTPSSSGSFATLFRRRLLRAHAYKAEPADLVAARTGVTRVTGLSQPMGRLLQMSWKDDLGSGAERTCIATGDSARTELPDHSVDLVVTDPPYMDNVHYSELADFFHVWLRKLRPFDGYPHVDSTRTAAEVQSESAEEFGDVLGNVWVETARVLKRSGLLAFTFHQARIEGWVSVVRSLQRAGLCVTALQPIKAEMASSITKSAAAEPNDLDTVVVCRASDVAKPYASSVQEGMRYMRVALSRLRDGGVRVLPADARSAGRGAILGLYTNPDSVLSLDDLVGCALEVGEALADEFAAMGE